MWNSCILDSSGGALQSISVLNPERLPGRRAPRACFVVSSRCNLCVLSTPWGRRSSVQFAFSWICQQKQRRNACCFLPTRCESCALPSTGSSSSESEVIQKALQALASEEEERSELRKIVSQSLRRQIRMLKYTTRFMILTDEIIDCYRLAVKLGDSDDFALTEEALSELHQLWDSCISQDDSDRDRKARNLHKLVIAFHKLRMGATIPLSASAVFDVVGSKLQHLRRFRVKEAQAVDIITTWPEDFLLKEFDAKPLQYFRSIGFSPRTRAAIVRGLPQVLWGDVAEFSKVVEFLESLGMSHVAIEKVVVQYPQVLTEETKLKALVESLQQMGADSVLIRRRIVSGRRRLHLVLQKDLQPLISRMQSINMDASRIDYIMYRFPGLLLLDVEKIDSMISYMESTLDLTREMIGEWLALDPQLFLKEERLRRTVDFFVGLGFDCKTIGKMLLRGPCIIDLEVETNLMPTATYIRELGLDLLKVLTYKPSILGNSVENKLCPNVEFLEDLVGRENVASLLSRHVTLLTLSVDTNLLESVKVFMEMGFTRSEIAEMLMKLPTLLSYGRTPVLLKHRFFVDYMKRDLSELVRYPMYFSYNIRKIITRFQLMGDLFPYYSLNAIYACTHEQFEKKLARWRRLGKLKKRRQRKYSKLESLTVGEATIQPE